MPQLRAHTSATCLVAHWPAAFFFVQKSGLLAGASAQACAGLGGCGGGALAPNAANGAPPAFFFGRKESKTETPPKVAIKAVQLQASTSQQVQQPDLACFCAPATCWYFRGRRRLRIGRLPSSSSSRTNPDGSSSATEVAARGRGIAQARGTRARVHRAAGGTMYIHPVQKERVALFFCCVHPLPAVVVVFACTRESSAADTPLAHSHQAHRRRRRPFAATLAKPAAASPFATFESVDGGPPPPLRHPQQAPTTPCYVTEASAAGGRYGSLLAPDALHGHLTTSPRDLLPLEHEHAPSADR